MVRVKVGPAGPNPFKLGARVTVRGEHRFVVDTFWAPVQCMECAGTGVSAPSWAGEWVLVTCSNVRPGAGWKYEAAAEASAGWPKPAAG